MFNLSVSPAPPSVQTRKKNSPSSSPVVNKKDRKGSKPGELTGKLYNTITVPYKGIVSHVRKCFIWFPNTDKSASFYQPISNGLEIGWNTLECLTYLLKPLVILAEILVSSWIINVFRSHKPKRVRINANPKIMMTNCKLIAETVQVSWTELEMDCKSCFSYLYEY